MTDQPAPPTTSSRPPSSRPRRGATALVVGLALASCSQDKPAEEAPPAEAAAAAAPEPAPAKPAEPAGTWYRAELAFEGRGELPFFLRLPEQDGEGALKNGDEAAPVDVRWKGDEVTVEARVNWTTRITA